MTTEELINALPQIEGLHVYTSSVVADADGVVGLVETRAGRRLAALASPGSPLLEAIDGERQEHTGRTLILGPLSSANLAVLRRRYVWLQPTLLGLRTSAGLGDRLGLATPGHLRAVRAVGGNLAPIPAQQSIREMARTARTPQQVMDDATWGVFAEGWRTGFGADADHLKTPDDVDACLATGYTFYTFDPGDHVQSAADTMPEAQVRAALDALPWERLGDGPAALQARYAAGSLRCEEHTIALDANALARAAVKYGAAVAHVAGLYRHLQERTGGQPVEVEVSVDETATPTTHAEHVYIATELQRLGVRWVSLAPRYVGRFEKGVDYIGDVALFERDFAVHAAIARHFGPYKLSLHSGSDKFSIYEVAARQTRGLVHLKTAGTSYLEALRTVAALDPELFLAIYRFARERYETDRASYHVSASLERAPAPDAIRAADLASLLEQFDAREILHVTFGSVLTARDEEGRFRFYDPLMALLRSHPDAYAATLEAHFVRHLRPFAAYAASGTTEEKI